MDSRSLPLFEPGASPPPADAQRRHLAAARRLSRRMGQLAEHSPQQVRVGRLICRHLVAMLKDIEANSAPH